MELIKSSKVIKEAFKTGFVKASLHIRDHRNKSHFIEFIDNELFTENEIIRVANSIGDGHRILAMTLL